MWQLSRHLIRNYYEQHTTWKLQKQQVNVKLYTAVSKSRSTIFSNEIFALPPENPADLYPATHISPAWGPISTNIHLSTAVIIPQRWRTQSSRRRSSWGLSAAFPPNSWCRRPTGCSQISVSTSDWFLSTSEVWLLSKVQVYQMVVPMVLMYRQLQASRSFVVHRQFPLTDPLQVASASSLLPTSDCEKSSGCECDNPSDIRNAMHTQLCAKHNSTATKLVLLLTN